MKKIFASLLVSTLCISSASAVNPQEPMQTAAPSAVNPQEPMQTAAPSADPQRSVQMTVVYYDIDDPEEYIPPIRVVREMREEDYFRKRYNFDTNCYEVFDKRKGENGLGLKVREECYKVIDNSKGENGLKTEKVISETKKQPHIQQFGQQLWLGKNNLVVRGVLLITLPIVLMSTIIGITCYKCHEAFTRHYHEH